MQSLYIIAQAALHAVLWNLNYTESNGEADEF